MSEQNSNQSRNATAAPSGSGDKAEAVRKALLDYVYSWSDWVMDKVSLATSNWEKMRDITENNYELGQMHLQRGNITDAIFRFRMVTMLEPKHADAWFFLGTAYMAEGKMADARKALQQAASLRPGFEEATYMLAISKGRSALPEDLPQRMPVSLAKSHFDSIASTYTEDQLEMGYVGHVRLAEAIRRHLITGRVDHEIVELGVGSGLCGPQMRDIAARIIGVDISGEMLAEAMKVKDENDRKVYDILLNREMHEFLAESPNEVSDIIMSATALCYVGDLSGVFSHVGRILRHGGIFAFTVDPMQGSGFMLDTHAGRYRFSQPYLESQAQASGLATVYAGEVVAYPDYPMLLCVFAK